MTQSRGPARFELGRRAWISGALATLAAGALAACSRRAATASGGLRIVSISPSTTEAIFAIGAGRLLVGRSRFCDHPDEARALPVVGGFADPSLEAIIGLRPDWIVGAPSPASERLMERLEPRGTKGYFPETRSVRDVGRLIRGLGPITGHAAEATRVAEALETRIGELRNRFRSTSPPRTLLVFGQRPLVAAGPKSFPGELIALAGAKNVLEPGAEYPVLGIEQVLRLDPDIVVDAVGAARHDGLAIDTTLPGWRELRAVRERRVAVIRDTRLLRPGPRLPGGLETLGAAIRIAGAAKRP